jgi:hypothetical protein
MGHKEGKDLLTFSVTKKKKKIKKIEDKVQAKVGNSM